MYRALLCEVSPTGEVSLAVPKLVAVPIALAAPVVVLIS